MVEARGGVVCIFHVNDAESWWRGAAESRRRACLDGLAQGGGTIWRHGGIDGWSGEGLHFGLSPLRWVRGRRRRCLLENAHKALSLDCEGESAFARGDQGTRPHV
jgi:hypothetical protein